MPEIFVSRMLEKTIVDVNGKRIGRVNEVYADADQTPPRVIGLGVAVKGKQCMVLWNSVQAMVREYFYLKYPRAEIDGDIQFGQFLRLKKDILDKQIVDLHGLKVVRVNDLKLAEIQGSLTLIAADIGFRGLLRRLGLRSLVRLWERRFSREVKSTLLNWLDIEQITGFNAESNSPGQLKLSMPYQRLRKLHPADLADIIEELDTRERTALFNALNPDEAADLLQEIEPGVQTSILEELDKDAAADIIEALPADEAADILEELDEDRAAQLLSSIPEKDADEVRELMDYRKETAGSLMTTDYLAFPKEITVDSAIKMLREYQPDEDMAYYLYVVDSESRLEGIVSLRNLIVSQPSVKLSEIMDTDIAYVRDTDDEEMVAEVLNKYGLLAVPVVDGKGVLAGAALLSDVVSEVYRPHMRKGLFQ